MTGMVPRGRQILLEVIGIAGVYLIVVFPLTSALFPMLQLPNYACDNAGVLIFVAVAFGVVCWFDS
jgi:hypothetical protein